MCENDMGELAFGSVKELENQLAAVMRGAGRIVLPSFGLDLAVFGVEQSGATSAHFFEVKAFSPDHGRCGFGDRRGEGNQIGLLFDNGDHAPRNESQVHVLDGAVRWIVGDRSRPLGSRRFLFLTCKEVQDAAMGGVRPGKQNNLRLTAFNHLWITWPELLKRIEDFIGDGTATSLPKAA